jgi:class 3 adenylate cyclase
MGDELMLVYATAKQAAESSVAIQEKVSSLARVGGLRLDFRIGFHFGDAIERDGDVFGDSVNTAARLVALAKAGQILTSSSTMAGLPETARPPMRESTPSR